jgi:hypothetical protein
MGVLWKPQDGHLRRTRFTHGMQFETERGEFYIDSEGNAREMRGKPARGGAPSTLRWGAHTAH